jgi:hypothetical protein
MILNILHLITVIIALVIADFASKGNFINDMFIYPRDAIFLVAYIFFARKVVTFTLRLLDEKKNSQTVFVPFIYFYIVFSSYLDGYSGGFSHTDSMDGKLFFILITPFLMLFTFYVPAIIFIVALLYSSMVNFFYERYVCK